VGRQGQGGGSQWGRRAGRSCPRPEHPVSSRLDLAPAPFRNGARRAI